MPHKTIPFLEEFYGKVRRYRMTLPCGKIHIAPKGPVWSGGFYLYLQTEKGSAGQTAEIRHFFEHKGERVVPGSFRLSVLPELGKAKNHFRDFLFSVHEFSSAGHEDTSILKERLDFWTSFTTGKKIYQFVGWSSYRLPEKSRELLKKYCNFYFFTYACIHSTMILQDADCDDLGFFVRGKVTRLGVPLFQNHNGRVNPGAICPQYLMGDPEGLFYGEYLRRGVEKAQKHFPGLNTFIIDYEPEAEKGTCDDCRRDFARFAKLDKVPTRDEIRPGKPYHRKWREYKLHQNRVIMNNIADGVKKHFPDMKVSFCCTELRPASEAVNTWDAVDAMALDGKTDFYSPMIYSSGLTFYNHLKYAVDNLKHAKVFPWIDPSEESVRFFSRYSPEKVRQNIVAAIALNAMGMMIYPTDILDGSYMKVISETADILAGAEYIYRGLDLSSAFEYEVLNSRVLTLTDEEGRRIQVKYPDLKGQVRAHLHEKDGVYILSVLNSSG